MRRNGRHAARAAAVVTTALETCTHEIVNRAPARSRGKVLAPLKVRRGLGLERVERRRTPRLADGMLARTTLSWGKTRCDGGSDGSRSRHLGGPRGTGALDALRHGLGLAMTTAKGAGRRRRQGGHVHGRRDGGARRAHACQGILVGRRRHLKARGARLRRRRVVGEVAVGRRIGGLAIDKVALLTRHGIIVRVEARLSTGHGRDDGLHVRLDRLLLLLLLLLLEHVQIQRGHGGRGKAHGRVHVQALHLVGGGLDTAQLLLQALLLFGEVDVGSDELGVDLGVHLLLGRIVKTQIRGRENLLGAGKHGSMGVVIEGARTTGGRGVIGSVHASGQGAAGGELLLGGRSSGGQGGVHGSGRLGSGAQAGEEVGARGARSRGTSVSARSGQSGFKGETLDLRSLGASGGEAMARHAQRIGHGKGCGGGGRGGGMDGERHVSKTAGVHAQRMCGGGGVDVGYYGAAAKGVVLVGIRSERVRA